MLMEAGAVFEARDAHQNTPLHFAASRGDIEACQVLMEAGAAIEASNTQQDTPLHLAVRYGHIQVCRMLMEAGAVFEARDVFHCTPLHVAAASGHIEACRILMEAGASVEATDAHQCTPLHLAAHAGHDGVCKLLTFEGADLTARSSTNEIPADVAQDSGHAALAAHLRNSNGAHCLRCTGPSLEPRLLWNDTNLQQQDTMLNEMQGQWLARVVEGCAHARVGLTLRGAFRGGLSTRMLLHIMGYVFGGTPAHLQSCISTGRVAASAAVEGNVQVQAVADSTVPAVGRVESALHGQGQQLPKRVLARLVAELTGVLHALARAVTVTVTPVPQPVSSTATLGIETRQQLQAALVLHIVELKKEAEGGCEWLRGYCDFLQRRHHRLGST
jgi:ankyrin repeat protein